MNWESAIKEFKTYLQLERSLSPNSVEAYLRDINKLVQFLSTQNNTTAPELIERKHLEGFLLFLYVMGLTDKSQARIVSGIRAFFKFLLMEDHINYDPSQLLELPKLKRKLHDQGRGIF